MTNSEQLRKLRAAFPPVNCMVGSSWQFLGRWGRLELYAYNGGLTRMVAIARSAADAYAIGEMQFKHWKIREGMPTGPNVREAIARAKSLGVL